MTSIRLTRLLMSSPGYVAQSANRRALTERGVSETSPYQSPPEGGMQHFHAWYRRVMGTLSVADV